ncbi:hypothetical protein [Aeromicrobium alkaliterrae]|uniref:hypothetical protein n=1 Tax=Aeromicrobium alkaliterrae TaxID=302168 RepID=UPI0031D0139A
MTDEFNLSLPVPFVNVDVAKDNRLFLDPSAIRVAGRNGDRYAQRAHQQLVDFFTEIITCARSSKPADQRRGLSMLQRLHEPNETRLGYSINGSRGHAFADEMGERLWETIRTNRTLMSGTGPTLNVQTAVLSRLEHLPLFIDRIDRDMISDMATRIVFDVLRDFTFDMIAAYPSIGASMATDTYPIWDAVSGDLVEKSLDLPVAQGKPLLLVPTNWIFWRTVMDPDQFYNRYATRTIQDEQTTYASDGKASKPSKELIKKNNKAVKETNVRQATKYADQHDRNLVLEYEQEIDANHEPMTLDEIDRKLQ